MSTTYNPTYPNPSDPPRNDVQTMQNNAQAIYNIWDKDHFTFDAATPGRHQIVTFPANVSPGAQTGLSSVVFTEPGLADATKSQLSYKNASITVPLSPIKAFATISGTTRNNYYNVSGVTNGTTGAYVVTMSTALPSTNYAVIATPYLGGFAELSCSYQITSTTQFTVFVWNAKGTASGVNVPSLSFVVLQV